MIFYPNCKINLGLRILRKRADAYHDLETVFYPLPFYDVLEIIKDKDQAQQHSSVSFSTTGLEINGNSDDNLCLKAYHLLKNDFPHIAALRMHLHKGIPAGAGLGGGSADGAFTLRLLNQLFRLGLSNDQLIDYALRLGSDCPFFIINQSCFATGRGERMEPIPVDLSIYKFILINPGIHISTANAFAGIHPAVPMKSIKEIIRQPVPTWKDELINDFESPVYSQYPAIETIKNKLYDNGAIYASMSGTGSTVYGIFHKDSSVVYDFPAHYFIKELISQPH